MNFFQLKKGYFFRFSNSKIQYEVVDIIYNIDAFKNIDIYYKQVGKIKFYRKRSNQIDTKIILL